ncbi:uncharacterized protein MKK02DRAFT_30252 [Dioszegia hungarica]|uniref:START domain-containing protein n=1 Tax=Dioszegia hungarica TaxID=4972 RepID=A0AA38H4J2_9TREE|nr:uncharacterized protein MKK02DRAFT_30252 [Dioszegia hungarica]KAI9632439.1 hypothetical protein MKK02DRAFT_30252 [Dioszegia hungarica]
MAPSPGPAFDGLNGGSRLRRDVQQDLVSRSSVSRRKGKMGEVYRAVAEVECGTDVSVDTFRGCLATPETRPQWDRMVEDAATLDLLDAHTRVTRTNYRLGWPSSPRDTVTLGKTFVDPYTLIDISTSVPRTRNEPPYLRPAPPHVRAHVALLAWCIQLPGPGQDIPPGRARITCMWSWDPKGSWAVGGGVPQHLPSVVVGLVDYVREGSEKVPVLRSYGPDVSIGSVGYDTSRVTLSVGYAIVSGETGGNEHLRRQVEFGISSTQSWDVQIHVKTQHGEESPSTVWTSFVGQAPSNVAGQALPKRLVLRFAHAPLADGEEMVRVSVSIERTSSSSGVRINGIPVTVEPMERPASKRPLLQDGASGSAISVNTLSTMESPVQMEDHKSGRTLTAEKSIAGLVRRNYIYFTSLLQEPEPKWRPVLDSRGVAVHQLNSIDKTLVVFRAEAVLVGVGIWDLFAIISNPSSRIVWDKSHEEATMLEDVNELSDLWYTKSKAAWTVAARDSVMLRTTYKSPSSIHVFGFSVDDTDLFPRIPPSIDPNVIRTQIDLQGWSVESLSPNTTQVTLLEQSDPRGWSNKSSIPQVMMSTLAGIGEFAIKHGAPPAATRLGGAKAIACKYDLERESYRFEYESASARRSGSSSTHTAFPLPVAVKDPGESGSLKSLDVKRPVNNIECEIRCDAEKWGSNIILVVDPPQVAISALKRHRLSPGGGGLWLTIEHDPVSLGSDKVTITVRRGTAVPGAKPALSVNGQKVKIDVEDLTEVDVQLLKKQKRARATRAPLDQPAALGTLRKRQSGMDLGSTIKFEPFRTLTPSTYSRFALPLARIYNVAAETTRAAIIPMAVPAPTPADGATPVDAAVQALRQLTRMHADRESESTDPFGWQPVTDREGLKIEKRVVSHVSETFPVYRAGRIIEGFTAEEVSAAVSSLRKTDTFDKPVILQSHGHGIVTTQITGHANYFFRSRSLLVATIVARPTEGPPPSPSVSSSPSLTTIFHASSSSFDPATIDFEAAKYNPLALPSGNVILEGWIIETIDPYSHEQYAIPSTRCMYVGAIDYSGNVPSSMNNMLNASLPRAILVIEQALKTAGTPSRARLPAIGVIAPDTAAQGAWSLEGVDGSRVGVQQRNDGDEYSLTVAVQPTSATIKDGDALLSPGLRHNESRSSFHSGRSTVIDLGEDIRRGRQDLTLAEIDIGSGTAGCEISIRGVSLPIAQNTSSDGLLSLTLPSSTLDLPFKVAIIALAPSVLQSASLDPTVPARHLLRVTLPTSGYEAPISDPLTGKTGPLPRPRWLLDLIEDGVVVDIRLKSVPGLKGKYTYNGVDVIPEDEKRSKVSTARARMPQLVNRDTPKAGAYGRAANGVVRVSRKHLLGCANYSGSHKIDREKLIQTPEFVRPTLAESASRYTFWKYPRMRANTVLSPMKTAAIMPPTSITSEISTTTDAPQPDIPTVPLPLAIIACLLCLLIGSLARSFLYEADFVVYLPAGMQRPPGRHWRELRRPSQSVHSNVAGSFLAWAKARSAARGRAIMICCRGSHTPPTIARSKSGQTSGEDPDGPAARKCRQGMEDPLAAIVGF